MQESVTREFLTAESQIIPHKSMFKGQYFLCYLFSTAILSTDI